MCLCNECTLYNYNYKYLYRIEIKYIPYDIIQCNICRNYIHMYMLKFCIMYRTYKGYKSKAEIHTIIHLCTDLGKDGGRKPRNTTHSNANTKFKIDT